jgi:hypothetical protein
VDWQLLEKVIASHWEQAAKFCAPMQWNHRVNYGFQRLEIHSFAPGGRRIVSKKKTLVNVKTLDASFPNFVS